MKYWFYCHATWGKESTLTITQSEFEMNASKEKVGSHSLEYARKMQKGVWECTSSSYLTLWSPQHHIKRINKYKQRCLEIFVRNCTVWWFMTLTIGTTFYVTKIYQAGPKGNNGSRFNPHLPIWGQPGWLLNSGTREGYRSGRLDLNHGRDHIKHTWRAHTTPTSLYGEQLYGKGMVHMEMQPEGSVSQSVCTLHSFPQ